MVSGILVSTDLMFISKVKEVAAASNATVRVVRSIEALEQTLEEVDATGVLMIDLEKTGIPQESLQQSAARALSRGWKVVSFFSHVHEEVSEKAKGLGLGEVMPRSRFVRLLPELF